MKLLAAALLIAVATSAGAQHALKNDDSCDIGVSPAATLLLPYFEVDITSPAKNARTTIFTVVNTSPNPQLLKTTLWSDWAYPVLTINSYLTGYGVASFNLRDLLTTGNIGQGAELDTPRGPKSLPGNPNFTDWTSIDCASRPTKIPASLLTEVQRILTFGTAGAHIGAGCSSTQKLGGVHSNAIGYATIDLVATCSDTLPGKRQYFTDELLFDNVLTGDWQMVVPDPTTGNYAGGSPLVHIRAIPEGGPAGSIPGTNLAYTFYDRFTGGIGADLPRTIDRRQPLPSTFAARYIQGGTSGFNTRYAIWREGYSPSPTTCNAVVNSAKPLGEVIRFDEHENGTASSVTLSPICVPIVPGEITLPSASSVSTSNTSVFPSSSTSGDVAGWMYINATNFGSPAYSSARPFKEDSSTYLDCSRQNQDWIVIMMEAEGRYAATFDAAALGNGCSKSPKTGATVGAAPNVTP